MKNKFYIGLVITIIIVAIVGLIIYLTQKKKVLNLTPISEKQMLFLSLDEQNNKIFYFGNKDKSAFYSYNIGTNEIQQLSDVLDTPDNVIWSPDKSKVILKVTYNKDLFEKYGSVYANSSVTDGTITFWLYDFDTKKLSLYNQNISNIVWSNDKIVYSYFNPDSSKNELYTADFDGKNFEKIDFPDLEVYNIFYLDLENKKMVFGVNSSREGGEITIDLYSTQDFQNTTLLIQGANPGLITVSPDGQHYSFFENNNLIFKKTVDNKELYKIKKLVSSKVGWSSNNLALVFFTENKDKYYQIAKINLQDNKKTAIKITNQFNDINAIFVSEKAFYFTNMDILYERDIES
ncbi:MAG: hypothetical protein HW405_48 [Candidatus Berkelbacteria bacterium]|nr:hypothetical protein [Candidatus Berkelbacteria bacterium]